MPRTSAEGISLSHLDSLEPSSVAGYSYDYARSLRLQPAFATVEVHDVAQVPLRPSAHDLCLFRSGACRRRHGQP